MFLCYNPDSTMQELGKSKLQTRSDQSKATRCNFRTQSVEPYLRFRLNISQVSNSDMYY
jgi:hypothetical protein